MNASRPFYSFHNIGGVECDFPSKEELLEYLSGDREGLTHIVTLNAEMIVEAQHNEQFKNSIQNAELVIPDGSSILWAKEYLRNRHPRPAYRTGRPDRGSRYAWIPAFAGMTVFFSLIKFFFSNQQPITGVNTIFDICEIIEKKIGTVYLLGGKPTEAEKTAEVLRKKYPELRVSLPLFKGDLPAGQAGLERVSLEHRRGHSAIFVALGSPKQSLWIEDNRETLKQAGITIAMGVGGAFAMIAETLPRAPKWMRRHHIEWLWRLMLEPSRIKRIWNAVIVFPIIVQKTT